ncbi:MAG: FAD-binding oxidoreductase [Brevundimonas sp.]|uniref:NAD(P)/FAD-dependent oxidoreductase n=1 Tax=Brevundimonas sp. TaxID=1871086 RepID=UPI00273361D9|nr:FAD-binding oxidoreductase [Brevundimonas sp.]MDP3369118.1 FAD-binding oxidoreductase [Brevundimonas sp.]MDP3657428.1 FAD-binding oxidoreductase [Brevundimonas sp.]MDZ4113192.1 FAD-binding oxidoreductase [Brevundimonas sp.]
MQPRSYLVIGGGLVGAASALRLQAAGFAVTLIDPGDPRRAASFGNIGHIAAEQVSPLASRESLRTFPGRLFGLGGPLDFRWRDAGLWGPWALRFIAASDPARHARGQAALTAILAHALPAWRRLANLSGAPGIVGRDGHAVVWMSEPAAEAGLRGWEQSPTGSAAFQPMGPHDLAPYAAVMTRAPVAGIRFSGTAQVSEPQAARDALMTAFTARGGEVVHARVDRLSGGDRVTACLDGGGLREAEGALVAAGAWAGRLIRSLGVAAPVIAERGYSVQSAEHGWDETLPPTVFEEHAMVVSRFTSGLRASSFVEFGAPDAPGDPRKWRALERRLSDLGVRFSPEPDRWVGPRPTLPDYLPAIGRLERDPRILYAFGHQHLGLTMAAITAELATALAEGVAPVTDLTPFRIERFDRVGAFRH